MDTENKTAGIIVIILIVAVGSGIFFLGNEENPDEYVYNNFRVFKNPTMGYTVVAYVQEQPYHLNLRNDPKNTENITIDSRIRSLILLKPATAFTLDPDLTSIPVLGATEMATILGTRLGLYNKQVIGAVTSPPENDPVTPVIDCENISDSVNVVRLQLGPETKVFLEKNGCIIVQGTNEWEIVRASDRLIYHILEVF